MNKAIGERLIIPKERSGFDALEVEQGRFQFFKQLFAKSGKMLKINLCAVLFSLPALVWFLYTYIIRKTYNISINYSGNLGLGYGMVENAAEQGNFAKFFASLQHYSILIPLLIIAFAGIGGAFYAVRKLAQGDERIAKNFFKGIKVTIADYFLYGLVVGAAILLLALNFTVYDAYGVSLVWKVFGILGSALLIIFLSGMLIYSSTISVRYKANLKTIIKDSFVFFVSLPIQTILLALIGILPFVVLYFALPALFLSSADMGIALIATLGVSLFMFLGISFVASSWTVYTDYVYDLSFTATKSQKKQPQKKG